MSVQGWTYLFVGVSFSVYLFIAWRARVKDTKGFFVAVQGIPAAANGMATAADWMSAASFLSYGGILKVVRADDDDLNTANGNRSHETVDTSLKIKNYDDYVTNYEEV